MIDSLIRPAVRTDVPAMNALYNHYVANTVVTFDVKPSTLEQRYGWFEQFGETGRYRLFVAEVSGIFAGYAGSMQFKVKEAYQTSVETTIYIDPDFQGRGIGPALYEALFKALEGEEVHRAYGGIALPNSSSVKRPSISSVASLLFMNTSRHMVGSDAAIRVKSRKPAAENFTIS